MDVYAEQSVSNNSITKRRTRTKILTVIRYICIAAAIFLMFFVLFWWMPISSSGNVGLQFLINFLFCLLMALPFGAAFILIGKYINSTNLEFDYYLNGDLFRVVKVINRKKRKKFVEISLSAVESIGRVTSDAYDRYVVDKGIKNEIAFCEVDDESDIIYVFYVIEGVKHLLHIQPDEVMLMSLRRGIPRISVLDKSLSMPIKKTVAEKENEEENK